MTICRTSEIEKLGSKFIKAKPLLVILFVFIAIILCVSITAAIIISGEPEIASWLFLMTMILYIIAICKLTIRADRCFNAFVAADNGTFIYINLGNIFMNSKLFGGQYSDVNGVKVFFEWFKAAKRMKTFENEIDFDNFVMSAPALNCGHYVEKVFSVKSKKKYIIAKVRLKQCNSVQRNMLTVFTKKIRIPKDFINSGILEMNLQRLSAR